MVMLKTSVTAPLETIYEESGSFVASTGNSQNQVLTNETINGLISARSIPPVNFHRQRACDNVVKPPIEVRFRDGSKRFIQPSAACAMMMGRKEFIDSSDADLSLNAMPNFKYQHLFNINPTNQQCIRRQPPIVITIITANDMKQAGFTPTDSSSPEMTTPVAMSTPTYSMPTSNASPALSTPSLSKSISNISQATSSTSQPISSFSQRLPTQQSILTESQSSSIASTAKTRRGVHKVSFAPLPPMTPVQSLMQSAINHPATHMTPPVNLPLRSPQQSIGSNNSRNSTPSQSSFYSSNSNSRASNSSQLTTLTNDMNKRNTPLQTVNPESQFNTAVAIGGSSHSAFRPFLRQMRLNQKSSPIAKRIPINFHARMFRPTQQQQQAMLSYVQNYQQRRQSQPTNVTKMPVHSFTTQNENSLDNQQQLVSESSSVSNSVTTQNLLNASASPNPVLSVALNPNVKWHNITSNDVKDIPKLARRFASIPLRIDLPVVSPHFNQKALAHHDTALERRLLSAGLSPETVALYERILDVAQNRPMSVISSPQAIDRYSYNSLL
ncbi:unnamed protein product [Adineta ricciae]|uniref:Uncharacterized protein n=3 Tax=Adineta ricciae TaxID=249248 RepID=A0A814K295_ADIRI|nr:unnamed protein product [Adineta ricciae]